MRIRVSIETGQSRSLHRLSWRGRAALLAVIAFAIAVPLAWASHDFGDVPTAHQFHAQISAIKGAGITTGCAPGLYCPDDFVRRDAMAAFMHRGYGRTASNESANVVLSVGVAANIASVTVQVPGAPGGSQFVVLNGTIGAKQDTGEAADLAFWLHRDGVGAVTRFSGIGLPATVGPSGSAVDSGAITIAARVPSGTTQTFQLKALFQAGDGEPEAWGHLTAVTVPFGSNGGDTLGSARGADDR